MTKAMRRQDYFPLVEKIRCRISTWTSRFLSYAGRLQLIKAVLMSLVNFWATVYLLPSKCIQEIESLCGAFLWSGPELKVTGAKVAWSVVCQTKQEGGLGIRALKVVNRVNVLKLIWRMLSGASLWGKWVESSLLKQRTFWEISEKSQIGSWMWRKMVKMRDVARSFHKKELGSGEATSFWFDDWSARGSIFTLLGERGIVDMGISREATVKEAVSVTRRRRHRSQLLNNIESDLVIVKEKLRDGVEDVHMWRRKTGFKQKFSTYETWQLMRIDTGRCDWSRSIWFSQATPKYAFIAWLAVKDRLSTMDRISKWNWDVDVICVFCKREPESRSHLFFDCSYSSQVWEYITKGILLNEYTKVWSDILSIIKEERMERKKRFCLRYAFQATIYTLWRERNRIKHDEKPLPIEAVMKLVDKGMRNKLSVIRTRGVKEWEEGLQFWFSTRV